MKTINRKSQDYRSMCDVSNQDSLWEQAIADAGEMMKQAQARAAELKRSIEILKNLRERGAHFPGTRKDD